MQKKTYNSHGSLTKKVINFLKENENKKYTTREIAKQLFKLDEAHYLEKKEISQNINSIPQLIQQISREISSQGPRIVQKNLHIRTTEGRPRQYYFSKHSDSDEITSAEQPNRSAPSGSNAPRLNEHNLYPLLAQFLCSELRIHSKRIDEKRSHNKQGSGGNKWLHPDLVGMEDLGHEWHPEIQNCVKETSCTRAKLWSFEVKILINRSNVREAFFQAVSNSSWANFGYLVASEIIGPDTSKELRILAGLHGIGLIKLDTDNPSESQIIIPAKERSEIDWDTANRLTDENKDFEHYIKSIRQFHQTGDLHQEDWELIESKI